VEEQSLIERYVLIHAHRLRKNAACG